MPVACMYIVHFYTHVPLHCWHMPSLPHHVRGTVETIQFLKRFFWAVPGTGPVEPQGHDLCLWHVCTLYITTHMSTCTVGTCQICPAMSEGQSKNSNFRNKECNIVKTHSCDSKEAKMRSRDANSDSNQQNPIFKYH